MIGLEEPETALHPAAGRRVYSLHCERRRTSTRRRAATSHSPDLLDNPDIDGDSLYAVRTSDGLTRIGRIDAAGREMLRATTVHPR